MIEVNQVGKVFGDITAVDNVSFSARRGEIFGLLGPNGAGKTTTLRMLYGLLSPTQGHLSVDGLDVLRCPLQVQAKMGVLNDNSGLYTRLTARENIRYFGQLHGMASGNIEAAIEKLSHTLGMENLLDRRTEGFSQGERMKVSLARCLVHDPDYVLLDEPTNGLDVMTTRAVRKLLLELKARGKCLVFSSHLMHEVANLCDHLAIISQGRLRVSGRVEEVNGLAHASCLEDAFVYFAYGSRQGTQQITKQGTDLTERKNV